MKKFLIGLGIGTAILLLFFIIKDVDSQHQQEVAEEYALCRSVGCSDAECKFFSHFDGNVKITCPNGNAVSKS